MLCSQSDTPLDLFLHLAAQDAGRLDQQDDDEDGEGGGVTPGRQAHRRDKALADADGQAADHGAGDGTDAAQNGGHEGFQAQHRAHGGGGLRIAAAVQHRADAGQGRAHRKGEGNGAVDVDAHQAGGVHVLRDGPHGLAQLGALDKQRQHDHRDDHDRQGQDGGQADVDGADLEHLVGEIGGDHLGARAQNQLGGVLQEEGDADGCDQQGQAGRIAQGGVGDLFDHHAQHGAGEDGGADRRHRAEAQLVHHEPGHIRAHHDDVAVGKVQQQDDAVHHAVAQSDQRVDAAQRQAVDQLAEKYCHGSSSFLFDIFCVAVYAKMRRPSEHSLFERSPHYPFVIAPQYSAIKT